MDAVCISVGEGGAAMRVLKSDSGYVLEGDWDGQDAVNAFLNHLAGRGFSAATVRAYAFDVANLSRFLVQQAVGSPRSMRRWCSTGSTGKASAERTSPPAVTARRPRRQLRR